MSFIAHLSCSSRIILKKTSTGVKSMAGFLTKKDGTQSQFHLGVQFTSNDARDAVEVQLDGDELQHVQNTMSNLPMASRRVVVYFGDHAKFIISNW